MSDYTINPMTLHETGAEILGLDLSRPVSEEVKKKINRDFAKYHVLCFRDQKLTPAQFAAAGEIFGPLMQHHHREVRIGHPDVYEVKQIEIEPGKYRIAGATFHTDHSNHPCPPKATALHTVSLPSYGGDTQFVNMHNAYDDLPEATKQRIAGLKALHVFESKFSPRKLRPLTEESVKELPPPALHPLASRAPL